jgi:tetratricopeptide (TPR) repeat protein
MSEELENIGKQDLLTRAQNWYQKNEKVLVYGVIGLVVLVGGYYAYQFYQNGKNDEAKEELYVIEEAFRTDSLDIILKGKNGGLSAVDIADEYSGTKSGNLAKFYAGYAFMKKGDYETAIEYFKSFDGKGDPLVAPNRLGMIGDCYAAKKEYKEAANYFEKAGKENINDLTTPHWMFKAGAAYEQLNDYGNAIDAYEYIIDNCPKVVGQTQVKKYLAYAKARKGDYTSK